MKMIFVLILILYAYCDIYSQKIPRVFSSNSALYIENSLTPQISDIAVSAGVGAILYLINPIIIYEDGKIYAGITKELSVGFGKSGEHRTALEYSFIFTGNVSHHLRLSYNYDLLMKKNIEPSHILQGTSVLSLGGGYFTNFSKQGLFPVLTYGYSLRNHKLLIYPHIKIRHTFMLGKQDSDITDISFGVILGIANPFTHVDIKRDN